MDDMTAFLTAIGTILTSFVGWLATITTALLANEVFQIMFGVLVALLVIGLVVGLAKGIRGRKSRKR